MVQLGAFGERKPAQLSGGQRQRVALARALVNRPKVLLLDEPLGALDLKLRQAMQIELKEIQQSVGLTFIYVTHDQEEALTMSDRLAVFNHGRIEQVGTPAEVYERPPRGSWQGSSGCRTCWRARRRRRSPATGRRSRSGRRRSRCESRARRVGPDQCSASGHVHEVVYLGAITRYIVQLDGHAAPRDPQERRPPRGPRERHGRDHPSAPTTRGGDRVEETAAQARGARAAACVPTTTSRVTTANGPAPPSRITARARSGGP